MNPGPMPGSGRSPGEGNGYPLEYFCPENSMDRGAGWDCRESEMTEQLTYTGQYVMNESLFPYIRYILPVVYVLYSISSERFIIVLIKC